jgi:metallo-beta-lactamase class B
MKIWGIGFLVALILGAVPASGQAQEVWRQWNTPIEPFRVIGNLYYVGAEGIAAFLITTPEGHIVLDGGFEETVPHIRRNIETLGFRLEDVKILLNSHAHFDHVGGLAELARLSGAEVMISEPDVDVVESGGATDFLFAEEPMTHFPPVTVDRRLKDRDTVTLGGVTLTAQLTAGHTKGCTTWTLQVEEEGVSRDVVFVCSVNVLEEMRLLEEPSYPGIREDFIAAFERLRSLPCDVFLVNHPGFFQMEEKLERLRQGAEGNPFIDPEGYQEYIEGREKVFREHLAKEREGLAIEVESGGR